jgi:hypothetical protein
MHRLMEGDLPRNKSRGTGYFAMAMAMAMAMGITMIVGVAAVTQAGELRDSETRARQVMKRSAEYIAGLENFRFAAELTSDFFEQSAEMVETGMSRVFSIKRPDRIRVEGRGRDATKITLIANPKMVLATKSPQNIHYIAPSPGSLDDVVDMITEQLGVRPPLSQMIYSNLWRVLNIRIASGRYVGEAEIDEVGCDHIAFRNLDLDWQVWVERGDRPVIRRLVIRYKSRLGHPTVRAELSDWEVDADLPDALFETKIPTGSRKVELSEIQG